MSLAKKDPSLRVAANDPHLVSLGGDRLSTAVTIHNIPVGDCTIGSSAECTVSLSGAGVKPIHCTIYRSEENQVILVPEHNARVLIDNCSIKTEVDLRQGAMITIGDSYYLRYNNPAEALKIRSAMEDKEDNNFSRELEDYYYETNFSAALKARVDKPSHSYYNKLKTADAPLVLDDWHCPKVFSADLITVNMPAKDVLGQKYAGFAKNLAEHHCKDKKLEMVNSNLDLFDNYLNKLCKSNQGGEKESLHINQLKAGQIQGNLAKAKENETDPLENMLKICAEYTDSQEQPFASSRSRTSSPIVQNRIITNGSLPRDKKAHCVQELPNSCADSGSSRMAKSNEIFLQDKSFDSLASQHSFAVDNMENSLSKIKLHSSSPKPECYLNNYALKQSRTNSENFSHYGKKLVKNCDEHFALEIENIEKSLKFMKINKSCCNASGRMNKTINNLLTDKNSFASPFSSPSPVKKSPCRNNEHKESTSFTNLLSSSCLNQWQKDQDDLLKRIQSLKAELNLLQKQGNEALIGIDMEQTLILADQQELLLNKQKLQDELKLLQQKIYRLEAQRNAARVIEENQQSKLQHSIEMKQDQVKKLQALLKQKPDNNCLQEELSNLQESLENDKRLFEDLEFQYLEGESEWQAYREDLNSDEEKINKQIEDCQLPLERIEKQLLNQPNSINEQQRDLSQRLMTLIRDLQQCELQFKLLERQHWSQTNSNTSLSEQEELDNPKISRFQSQLSQSLHGSVEMLSHKTCHENLMSKSFNENMLSNNHIEFVTNELTFGKANSKRDNIDLKAGTTEKSKINNETGDQEQPLDQKGLRELKYQRRKIEEILKNLSTSDKTLQITTTKIDICAKLNSKRVIADQHLAREMPVSPAFTNSPPSSATSIQFSENCLPNIIDKSVLPQLTRYMDARQDNSKNSNEISHQDGSSSGTAGNSNMQMTQQQRKQRPLTRYLPIFGENFDLKRHIESAGHPLSLCRHVFLDAHSCRGYLHKLGSTFHTWSKRWFVLDRQRSALVYYADKTERKPRGGSYFAAIDEVYLDHLNISKSGRTHSTFIVKTKKKTYYLQANTDTAARIWIDAIITGAQGSVDY